MKTSTDKPVPANKIKWYITFLFFLSLFQYIQTINNNFVWDSEMVLTDPTVREFKYLPSYFTEEFFKNPANDIQLSLKYYRPLVKTVNLVEYNVFRANPIGYNALSILLNAIVVVLCFVVVNEITGNLKVAFISSILYAVNPIRVEAVSHIYALSHLMTAFFSLSSFYLYLKRKYIISAFIFSLSLLSHESAVLLPFILIAYEYCIRHSNSLKDYRKILPFFFLVVIYLIIRNAAVGSPHLSSVGILTFINSFAVVIKRYIKIFFLPDAAVTIYPKELFSNINAEVAISYLVLFLAISFGVLLWNRKKEYLFWLLWFYIWIAIYCNVGTYGEYLMTEKALYLSSIGFCVLIAFLTEKFPAKRMLVYFLIAALSIFYSGMTFSRNTYWKETIPYLRKALEFSPNFYLEHYALGSEYSSKGLHDMAIEEFRRAVLLRPEFARLHFSLGNAYIIKGDYQKALFVFREATKLHPKNSAAYNDMGNILYILGDLDNAVTKWEKAIELDPLNAEAYYNIGIVMEKRNDLNSALIYYKKYLYLSSNPAQAAFSRIQQIKSKQSKSTK